MFLYNNKNGSYSIYILKGKKALEKVFLAAQLKIEGKHMIKTYSGRSVGRCAGLLRTKPLD